LFAVRKSHERTCVAVRSSRGYLILRRKLQATLRKKRPEKMVRQTRSRSLGGSSCPSLPLTHAQLLLPIETSPRSVSQIRVACGPLMPCEDDSRCPRGEAGIAEAAESRLAPVGENILGREMGMRMRLTTSSKSMSGGNDGLKQTLG
jgi:hypothetical protein